MTGAHTAIESEGGRLGAELAAVAETLRLSTVHVRSGSHAAGSGTAWRPEGVVITNSHVVSGDTAMVELADGRALEGRVTARDPDRDLAVVSVRATDLRPAPLRSSESVRVGELVFAVGSPLGVAGAVTAGVVHSVGKPARVRRGPFGPSRRARWVQADIRLQPGNSGGPLADARGRVVGINTMIAGGLALAVPSLDVERFVREGTPRPFLGVTGRYVPVAVEGRRGVGLAVSEVGRGSLARAAGLMPGDVLVGTDGEIFESHLDVSDALREGAALGGLRLDVARGGRLVRVEVRARREAA
jgi:serine protease Do